MAVNVGSQRLYTKKGFLDAGMMPKTYSEIEIKEGLKNLNISITTNILPNITLFLSPRSICRSGVRRRCAATLAQRPTKLQWQHR